MLVSSTELKDRRLAQAPLQQFHCASFDGPAGAFFVSPFTPITAAQVREGVAYAHTRGRHVLMALNTFLRADDPQPWYRAVDSAVELGADALIVIADPALMDNLRGRVADLAATHRLPAMYNWKM